MAYEKFSCLASQGVVAVQRVARNRVDHGVHGWVLRTDHLAATEVDADVAATVLEYHVAWLRVAGANELAVSEDGRVPRAMLMPCCA